jgi:hypothetical protein
MELTRRRALAGAAGAVTAGTMIAPGLALGQTPQRGGTLTVQLTSEQRVLNPMTLGSTKMVFS